MTIFLENIAKRYGETEVLSGVHLELVPGRVTALVGASGSGKTTLLNIIAGLVEPTTGRVLFDGCDVTSLTAADRQIGYLFQSFALFPHLDVVDNVAFGLRVRGVPRRARRERAMVALEMVRLAEFAHRSVDALSGGQRQRVALARALAIEPHILLLDEPLSALDPLLRRSIREELRELLEPLAVTSLLVTHDQADAFVLADEIVMLSAGKIVQAGSPRDLYQQPCSAEVAHFFGAANFLARDPRAPTSDSDSGLFMFRPEDVDPVVTPTDAHLCIRVEGLLYLGDRQRITGVLSCGTQVTVDLAKERKVRMGEQVHLRLRDDAVWRLPKLLEERTL